MICVACNQKSSFDNIDKWRNEISEVEPEKPVMLILTKSDMIDLIPEENAVQFEKLTEKSTTGGFQGACQTSSKEWEDFNVHKAFNKTLITAYKSKNMSN